MVELIANIFADGPQFDPYNPDKRKVRDWGTRVEGIITAFVNTGGTIFFFKTTMDGFLTPAINSIAWVLGDPVVENNGIYKKLGASGTGSWQRMGDLPYSFIIANDAGAGTPNAIQATSSLPVSASALVWLQLTNTNTSSPVTIQFNDGPVLTVKTNAGEDVIVGGLTAGCIVMGVRTGSIFRLVTDQASSAIVAAAEAAQAAAEAAAASVNIKQVANRTALKAVNTALTTLVFLQEAGREGLFKWTPANLTARVASDPLEGIYVKATAVLASAGAWVRQGDWAAYGVRPEWFGARGDGVDDTAALEAVAAIGFNALLASVSYATYRKVVPKNGTVWNSAGGGLILTFDLVNGGFFYDTPTKILLRGTGLREHTIAGATSRTVANPDVGAPYLADSGTRGNVYRNNDYSVAFSAGVILGPGCKFNGIGVYTYFDGVDGYKGTDGRLSDDWDVGIWSRNADWAGGENTVAYGHFRKAAFLMSAHDIGDGRTPSAESQRWVNCKFQGYWGVDVRSPEVIVGNNWGFADSCFVNCDIRSLSHQSGHLATSSALAVPFSAPSGALCIAGGTMARINIIGGRRMGRDDIMDFFGNCEEILIVGAYAEAQAVKVNGSFLANGQGSRNIAFSDSSSIFYVANRKYATDLSPKKPRDVALPGRYTVASAGVFNPNYCEDDDSDKQRFTSYTGPRLSPGQGFRVQDALNNMLFQIASSGIATFGSGAGLQLASYTSAQFADITHPVNTTGKFLYREYYNSTTGRKMRANGGSPGSTWLDMMGTNTITPV